MELVKREEHCAVQQMGFIFLIAPPHPKKIQEPNLESLRGI